MTLPAFVLGAALAFWGWETGNLALGLALAVAVETLRHFEARFDLEPQRYERLADLCTVAFVALAVTMVANRGLPHGVLAGFQYVPVTLAPILLAQYAASSRRIRLSALFRYIRKMKQRDPATLDPLVDLSAPFLATTLLAAGVANQRGPAFYLAVLGFAAWALWTKRPRHARIGAWVAMFAVAAGLGHAGHVGLNRLQDALEDWISEWQLRQSTDPSRASTDIGSLGRLKQHDAVLARVYAPRGDNAGFRLLHRASFNVYGGNAWHTRNAPLGLLSPGPDGASWILAPGEAPARLRVAAKTDAGRAMLPLPAGTRRIEGLPAPSLRGNEFGAVLAEVPEPWVRYEAAYGAGHAGYAAPVAEDLQLPPSERATLERLATELGLSGLAPEAAVAKVQAHLGEFRYSTFRDKPVPRDRTPLADFLLETRAGHCEYFAASAALLLRAAGVPARYATGFAVIEWSELEGAWLVRARHAHAWTRAWIGERWMDLDPTPTGWDEAEASQAPLWQPLADLFRYAAFRWSQREQGDGASDGWVALAAILFAILAWRIVRGRRSAAAARVAVAAARCWPGQDSAFYALEAAIASRHGARTASESLSAWLSRVQPPPELAEAAKQALALHYRLRFDPAHAAPDDGARLAEAVALALQRVQGGALPASKP